jgi:hypothetical protein
MNRHGAGNSERRVKGYYTLSCVPSGGAVEAAQLFDEMGKKHQSSKLQAPEKLPISRSEKWKIRLNPPLLGFARFLERRRDKKRRATSRGFGVVFWVQRTGGKQQRHNKIRAPRDEASVSGCLRPYLPHSVEAEKYFYDRGGGANLRGSLPDKTGHYFHLPSLDLANSAWQGDALKVTPIV